MAQSNIPNFTTDYSRGLTLPSGGVSALPGIQVLSQGSGGGNVQGASTVNPNVAEQAAAAAAARGSYNSARDTAFGSINDAIKSSGTGYRGSILDYLDTRAAQQRQIDSDAVQNELSRQQGMQSILDMVGSGVKSSGTILANKNAGSSSAAEAIARAYGILGRQQATGVGNQFAQGQNKIATAQENLGIADATQRRHSEEDKTNVINGIVNSARAQLAQLNASAQNASLPDRVNIEAKIAEIRQQALDALTGYDAELSGGISRQTPLNAEGIRARATSLLTSGVVPENQFNYTTEQPAQFQDTGQFASSLPIFISPRRNPTA